MSQVVLYGTKFCPYCIAARRLLTTKGIHYQDIRVDSNQALRRQIINKSGRSSVPQIWIGTVHVGGYNDLRELASRGELDPLIQSEIELPQNRAI